MGYVNIMRLNGCKSNFSTQLQALQTTFQNSVTASHITTLAVPYQKTKYAAYQAANYAALKHAFYPTNLTA